MDAAPNHTHNVAQRGLPIRRFLGVYVIKSPTKKQNVPQARIADEIGIDGLPLPSYTSQ